VLVGPLALALVLVASGARATVIDTVAPWTGNWSSFGEPNTATYGQTFTAPDAFILDSFSLFLAGAILTDPPGTGVPVGPSPHVDFAAYVYAWDGAKAVGPALFTSEPQAFFGSPPDQPVGFTFLTGGLALTPGQLYVAFLSASPFFDGVSGRALMPFSGSLLSDPYPGGGFVFARSGGDFSLLLSRPWDRTTGTDDVWFRAEFSAPIPEAASVTLLGAGLVGLSLLRRRARS
jgi:hypothetical protein